MSIPARLIVALLFLYRRFVSPLLGRHCRYEPTCSAYAVEAVTSYGAVTGSWMAIKRIGRCHPWGPGGLDPVPARRTR
jgi:putative membrane protein insertion efficiency factor